MKYIQKTWSLLTLLILATIFASCGATSHDDPSDDPITGTIIARYYPGEHSGEGYMQDSGGMRMKPRNESLFSLLSEGVYRFDVSYKPSERSGDFYYVDITSAIENLTCTDMAYCEAPEPSQPLIAVKYSDRLRPLFFDDDYLLFPVPFYSKFFESSNPGADVPNHRFLLSYDPSNDQGVNSVMELTITDLLVGEKGADRGYGTFVYRAYKYSDYVKHFKENNGVLSSIHIKGICNYEENSLEGAYEAECSLAVDDR